MTIKTTDVIVVEGQSDVAFLEQFIDAIYVITNGSAVSRETLDYICELAKTHKIIVFTDPDSPGKRIRDLVEQAVGKVTHVFLNKKDAVKKHKVGVAEASKQAVLSALAHELTPKEIQQQGSLTTLDLYDLHLVGHPESAVLRQAMSDHFHLGFNNGKTLLKRLNSLNISKEKIAEYIKEYRHENSR